MPMDLAIKAGGGEGTALFNKDTFIDQVDRQRAGRSTSTSAMMPAPVKVTIGPDGSSA